MVDAADHEKLEASRNELHGLLEKPQLAGIPVSSNQCINFARKQVAQVFYALKYKASNYSVSVCNYTSRGAGRGFTNISSRRTTGFHRWAKLFELNFKYIKKNLHTYILYLQLPKGAFQLQKE